MTGFYPFPTYRPGVKEATVKIRKAFEAGKRFVVVDAPTGCGKSGMSVDFAREFKCVILTPTKLLQDQYASTKEFEQEYIVAGKSNYQCGLPAYPETRVDEAICCSAASAIDGADDTPWADAIKASENPQQAVKLRCSQAGICEYYGLINSIGKKPGAVLNYDLFFHIKKTPGGREGVDMGEYLVMDEAHQLINKIKDIFGYQLSNSGAVKILGGEAKRNTPEAPHDWLKRLQILATVKLTGETDRKAVALLNKFQMRLGKLLQLDIMDASKFYIEDKQIEIEIKPLNMKYLKNKIFHPFKKVLFLTATPPSNFCELLGITPDEVEHIAVPSIFPKANRPVRFATDMPTLNYKTEFNKEHPVIRGISSIIEKHKGDKGIIHCANYKFFNQLKGIFGRNARFIWVEQGQDKVAVMSKHASTSKDSILVSPSMIEGIDLKDDLARFQIMVKLPFPMLDDYTKKMMAIYPGFYESAVAMNIVQAYGRAVRSEKDHAVFYILDGAAQRYVREKKWFSTYFTEALEMAPLAELLKRK